MGNVYKVRDYQQNAAIEAPAEPIDSSDSIVEVVQKLSLAKDLETVMFIVRKAARKFTNADGATFVLKRGNECFYAAEDAIAPLWQGKQFPMSVCVSGWVMQNKQSVVIEDIFSDERVPVEAYRPTFVKSLAMVPIRSADPIGAIGVYWAEHMKPSDEQLKLLISLADSTSVSMENIRLQRELNEGSQENLTQLEMTTKLIEANKTLENTLLELNQRQLEMQVLRNLSSRLQICVSIDEAYEIIKEEMSKLLSHSSGQLYVMHNSRNFLEAMTKWGNYAHSSRDILKPEDCLALRSGMVNRPGAPVCKHYQANSTQLTCSCIPLYAQSEVIGLLALEWEFDAKQINKHQSDEFTLSGMIAEQIALGLSNIKLRETLKNQSVRDPLTGLYNRRYVEECLERELQRCKRNTKSLAVIMLDIDHFKRFNDIYGHGAGDLVITEVAMILSNNVRKGSDISSRYGGEEFLIVLPEILLNEAYERAETIRKEISSLELKYNNVSLPTITISLGLAIYPEHAEKIDKLIEFADNALYKAKNNGRNQVVVYQFESP
jgi:diguanylate cyclase (GGDEF)-like protein